MNAGNGKWREIWQLHSNTGRSNPMLLALPMTAAALLPFAARSSTAARGRSRTVTVLKCGRSAAVFPDRRQLPGNGRFHRNLHFSTNSANGGLQSTSATGSEKRQRRAWGEPVRSQPCTRPPTAALRTATGRSAPSIECSGRVRQSAIGPAPRSGERCPAG